METKESGRRKTDSLSIRIDPEVKQELAEVARRKDRSIAWLVKSYIVSGLRRCEPVKD
jgi:predicted transcriptional regulator